MMGTHKVASGTPEGCHRIATALPPQCDCIATAMRLHRRRCAARCADESGLVCGCNRTGVRTGVRMPAPHRCADANTCKPMTNNTMQDSVWPLGGLFLAPSLGNLVRQPSQTTVPNLAGWENLFFDGEPDGALSRAGSHGGKEL